MCGSSLNLHEEREINFFTFRDADVVKSVFLLDAGKSKFFVEKLE